MSIRSSRPATLAGFVCVRVRLSASLRRVTHVSLCLLLLGSLAACAGSVAPPTVVQALPQERATSLLLTDVTAEAAAGVVMTPDDLARITQEVRTEINESSPGMLLPAGSPPTPQAMLMKIVLTRYDEGNAFARFMLAGLGQIYIEGNVLLIDSQTQQQVANYQVSKDFSFGGIYGGSTTIRNVEKGFARSVAEGVKHKT